MVSSFGPRSGPSIDHRGEPKSSPRHDCAGWCISGGGRSCRARRAGAGGFDPSCKPGVSRIDTHTNRVTTTFDVGGAADAVALYGDSLWYGTTGTHELGRIDTRTNKVVSVTNLPGAAFNMTADAHAVWTTDRDDEALYKVLQH